jgi:hypothetical protein
VTIDLDALLAPIDNAIDTKAARSAVWAVLRMVKRACWRDEIGPATGADLLAAIDAAAWAQGCSEAFRNSALAGALMGHVNGADEWFRVIPTNFPATVNA